MDTPAEQKAPKPENACLSDASLLCLIKELGNSGVIMKFAMYLNIPNTTIVKLRIEQEARGLSDKDLGAALIKHWKVMKGGKDVKDKNKVNDIERALQPLGRGDVAEVFMECYRNQTELTPSALQ